MHVEFYKMSSEKHQTPTLPTAEAVKEEIKARRQSHRARIAKATEDYEIALAGAKKDFDNISKIPDHAQACCELQSTAKRLV